MTERGQVTQPEPPAPPQARGRSPASLVRRPAPAMNVPSPRCTGAAHAEAMTKHQPTEDTGSAEARTALREAVGFLLTQEMARLENSVRFASEHARARDLRRRLHLTGESSLLGGGLTRRWPARGPGVVPGVVPAAGVLFRRVQAAFSASARGRRRLRAGGSAGWPRR